MQTKVIYLNGNMSDEEKLNGFAEQGYRLQSTTLYQGQIVGYMVREPWLASQPLEAPKTEMQGVGAKSDTSPEVRPAQTRLPDQRGKHNRR